MSGRTRFEHEAAHHIRQFCRARHVQAHVQPAPVRLRDQLGKLVDHPAQPYTNFNRMGPKTTSPRRLLRRKLNSRDATLGLLGSLLFSSQKATKRTKSATSGKAGGLRELERLEAAEPFGRLSGLSFQNIASRFVQRLFPCPRRVVEVRCAQHLRQGNTAPILAHERAAACCSPRKFLLETLGRGSQSCRDTKHILIRG